MSAADVPPSLRDTLQGAVVMAPMTKGSNLPYRQLCQEFGARVTMSEMAVARRLKQKRRGEFALIRRAVDERFFGVQLAGNNPEEMAWAAQLVEARGADLVDVNLGCPIDYFTSTGLGAALAREPKRVILIVYAMKQAVKVPLTV
jgi:tRNA-dihydrouridine synthase